MRVQERAKKVNARHLAVKGDWGTPPEVLDIVREVLGGVIDVDACSSAYWNEHTVHATNFMDGTPNRNGITDSWRWASAPERKLTAIVNPPGDPTGEWVKGFWRRLVSEWWTGCIASAVWVGFSLEQLVPLQRAIPLNPTPGLSGLFGESVPRLHPMSPLLSIMVPDVRMRFLQRMRDGSPPRRSDSPSHGNYLVLLHDRHPSVMMHQLRSWKNIGRDRGWATNRG